MTERERLLEKIRKVQALANRGADGEKQSAAALLDKLMKQYGIDEAEIAEERLEKCFFRSWKSNSAMSFIKPRWKRKWNGSIRRS